MASVIIEMSGDEAKLWRSWQRVQAKGDDVTAGLRKMKSAGQAAGKQMEDSFGGRASAYVGNLAMKYASLTTGIQLAGQALAFARKESDEALASMKGLVDANRSLAQIAVNADDLKALTAHADALASAKGIDRNAARRLLFSARSEGFEQAIGSIASNAIVVDAEAQAIVAGQVPALFKGKITPAQAINATLVAAEQSRLNFEQIARALPSAAQGAAQAGSSPAETLALLSVLASRYKSGDEAATGIKAFGAKVALDPALAGKGIVGAFQALQRMPESQRRDFLKENEQLNSVYAILSEDVATVAERGKLIAEEIRIADSARARIAQKRLAAERVLGGVQRVQASEAAVEIAKEMRGNRGAQVTTDINEAMADLRAAGATSAGVWWAEKVIQGRRAVLGDTGMTEELIRSTAAREASPPFVRMFTGSAGEIRERMEAAREQREREMNQALMDSAKALREASNNLRAQTSPPDPAAHHRAPMALRELNSVPAE